MLIRRICVVLAAVGLTLVIGGCAPSIVSSDAGVYSAGRLYAVTSQDMTAVYEATLKAMQQLELDVSEAAKDVFYAKVVAKGADGKTITVRIKPREGGGTDLRIGVGAIGNRQRSSVVYERIRENLGLSQK